MILCLGGACIDRKYRARSEVVYGTSNSVRAGRSFGGVARNVAENLARLGVDAMLFSAVGDDDDGRALLQHLHESGVETSLVSIDAAHPTAEYAAVLGSDGDLLLGVSDMRAIESIAPRDLDARWERCAAASWMFVDCNATAELLSACIARARSANVRVAVDPVSEPKTSRLPIDLSGADLLFMNEREATAYLGWRPGAPAAELAWALRERGAASVVLTLGASGALVASDRCVQIPPFGAERVDATGAGDALIAGVLYATLRGEPLEAAARVGTLAAALTIGSVSSVRPDISGALLEAARAT